MDEKRYIPALSFRWLTPIYDPILKWVMREDNFKHRLVQQVNLQPGMKVLDLGCGTGTLTVMLKEAHPNSGVTGLDGDSQVLDIAREKAGRLNIRWEQGLAYDLPYSNAMFDRLVTSLMHGLEKAADNFDGRIPHFIAEAGFEPVTEVDHFITVSGPLSLCRAVKGK